MTSCCNIATVARWGNTGTPWWQLLGSFILVAGLLILVLKFLARWQHRAGAGDLRLLSVSAMGPRRALETLRYGQEILLIYRSEGAMVLIDRKSLGEYAAQQPPEPTSAWQNRFKRFLGPRP